MGIIDRRRAAGTFRLLPAGSAGKLVLYSKEGADALPALVSSGYQQIQNAGSAGIVTSILPALYQHYRVSAFYQRFFSQRGRKG